MKKTNNRKIISSSRKINSFWYTVGLVCYSFTSLIFLVISTRINGVDLAGVFTFAFSFACTIQVIALFAGRTYQVTEQDKRITQFDYLIFKIITCIFMFAFAILFIIIRSYEVEKIFVIVFLVLYKGLDAYSESIFAIFQRHNNLFQCGISMFIKSVFCVFVFLAVDVITKNLVFSCFSIFICDIAIFILYDCLLLRKYKISKNYFDFKKFKILFVGGLSVCIFTLLIQYVLTAQKYIIDLLLDDYSQAVFGIIIMPATFMAMCSQLIINPFLYDINKFIRNDEYKKFINLIKKIIRYVLLIGFFVLLLCFLFGIPILNFIYGFDLSNYLGDLIIIIIGSIAFAIVSVMSNVLVALRKNSIQVIIYLIVSVFATLISLIFINYFYLAGATYSFIITMLALLIFYTVAFLRNFRNLI